MHAVIGSFSLGSGCRGEVDFWVPSGKVAKYNVSK